MAFLLCRAGALRAAVRCPLRPHAATVALAGVFTSAAAAARKGGGGGRGGGSGRKGSGGVQPRGRARGGGSSAPAGDLFAELDGGPGAGPATAAVADDHLTASGVFGRGRTLKRDQAAAYFKAAQEVVSLEPSRLESLRIDEDVREAALLAQRLRSNKGPAKHGRRRQERLVAQLMRGLDAPPEYWLGVVEGVRSGKLDRFGRDAAAATDLVDFWFKALAAPGGGEGGEARREVYSLNARQGARDAQALGLLIRDAAAEEAERAEAEAEYSAAAESAQDWEAPPKRRAVPKAASKALRKVLRELAFMELDMQEGVEEEEEDDEGWLR